MLGLFKRKKPEETPVSDMTSQTATDAGPSADHSVMDRIKSEVDSQDVVLFMKGTPVFPQCGFSAAVIQIMSHMGVKFKGVNVLDDMEIREGIKAYSNWPTIPQLYVKGEFVGGCDIIREMFEAGELQEYLTGKGIQQQAA